MRNCLFCGEKRKYPLCNDCSGDPFKIEKVRQTLATLKDYDTLKKMYKKSFREIKDLNKSDFWDNKLYEVQTLDSQDGMTNERVGIAVSYIFIDSKKILDVGAGYGFLEEKLTKNNYDLELYGFDISQAAVKNLSKRFKGNFIVGDIYNIPYYNTYFDVILALEVFEHIPPSNIFNVLKDLKKILPKGKTLVISVPLNENLKNKDDNPSGHVREYTKELIFAELEMTGFEVTEYTELCAFSSFYRFKKILQKLIFQDRWKPNDIIIQAKRKS